MARIQQLSPQVVAQIAAGEVIERPASVLKELLENAIDAGSSRIDVDVGAGGTEYLRVVDDGCGIEEEDLALAFAAHATSKLRNADELFQIGTLGFRGEGLASIGGVARVTLQSRLRDLPCGAEVQCNGGELVPPRVWNGAPGTRVEVRQLFFNTPVRRKFLKGSGTEMGHVTEVFTRLALSQLSLHLTLRHNGKTVYDVAASAGLLDRIAIFFGDDVRKALYLVEAESGSITLGGYVANPSCERAGTGMQYVYVNGRWVRDRGVSEALQDAYRGLVMVHRNPVGFLSLELPPDEVDVNVHPTKTEVRFRQPERVYRLVRETVRARLEKEDLTAALRAPAPAPVTPPTQAALAFNAPEPRRPAEVERQMPRTPAPDARPRPPAPKAPAAPPAPAMVARSVERRTPEPVPRPAPVPTPPPVALAMTPPPPVERPIKAVQLHDLYLVVEVPEGMLVIDQHALHERILYEEMRQRWQAGALEVQRLLIPEAVDLTPQQAALVLEHQAALAELGLEVSDFGGGTVLLAGYPALLRRRSPREVLRAVVEHLAGKERVPTREVLLDELLSLMACHAAVRAGDRLTPEEIAELAARRDLARDAHHCPHGRPTSLLFTRQELDRQFRRV